MAEYARRGVRQLFFAVRPHCTCACMYPLKMRSTLCDWRSVQEKSHVSAVIDVYVYRPRFVRWQIFPMDPGRPSRFHDENWFAQSWWPRPGRRRHFTDDNRPSPDAILPFYHTTRSGFHGMGPIVDLYYRCRTEMVLRLAPHFVFMFRCGQR